MLTYEEIRKAFSYNPETGVITRIGNATKRYIGKPAGSLSKGGYIDISCKNRRLYGHRVAWMLTHKEWPDGQVDHINGIRDDNRLKNLRVVNNQQNHANMKKHKGNSSGTTGVYWSKKAEKWQAYICVNSKRMYLGIFSDIEDARTARKDAEVKYNFHKNHGR